MHAREPSRKPLFGYSFRERKQRHTAGVAGTALSLQSPSLTVRLKTKRSTR